jgi:hypothetical protein
MAENIQTKNVDIYYDKFHTMQNVSLLVPPRAATTFMPAMFISDNVVAGLKLQGVRRDYTAGRFG